MNWDAIAAVGELVGGLAVIVSLLYLATQIRISNRIARGESQRSTYDLYDYFSQLLDEKNRRIFVLGLSEYEDLSLDERLCFSALVHPLVNQTQAIWMDWQHGLQLETVNHSWQRGILAVIATNGGRQWWKTSQYMFSDEYSAYISDRLDSENPAPIYDVFPEYGFQEQTK